MRIGVIKETVGDEARVALTPEIVKDFIRDGHHLSVVKGAGSGAGSTDAEYKAAGAHMVASNQSAVRTADIVLSVRGGDVTLLSSMKAGAGMVGLMSPADNPACMDACRAAGVSVFALEYIPRISRAQSMDVLSSQANLAGYRVVIEAAGLYGRAFPMMMTAAGTIAPAKVFVMGAGVAGLQAIATARRLGAVTTATDVRPAAKEQVASLGARFIAVENAEFIAAQDAGGYAKAMSKNYQKLQAQLIAEHIARQDIVITTALIPNRPAPRLVSKAMLCSMRAGSVVIDMAIERGGNCAGTKAGEIIDVKGVRLVGYQNWPSRMATDASQMFARNLKAFLPLLTGKEGAYAPHWDDEIIAGCALSKEGVSIHPTLK